MSTRANPGQWANLRLTRVRLEDACEMISTPVLLGIDRAVELWEITAEQMAGDVL